jgi:hypothetical protein
VSHVQCTSAIARQSQSWASPDAPGACCPAHTRIKQQTQTHTTHKRTKNVPPEITSDWSTDELTPTGRMASRRLCGPVHSITGICQRHCGIARAVCNQTVMRTWNENAYSWLLLSGMPAQHLSGACEATCVRRAQQRTHRSPPHNAPAEAPG